MIFPLCSSLALAQDVPEGREPPARPAAAWTVMIYGAADNNADGHMLDFLNKVRGAVADDPGIELVLFIDRSTGYSTDAKTFGEDFTGARLYRLGATTAKRLAGGDEFPEIALDKDWEADSADPENLRKFLRFGKARFPAKHHALLIYGHADGITLCPDEQSRHAMGIAELADVVTEAESVEFAALELCNMGGVEIAYQWRPGNGGFSTDVLVAIPNAGPPLDWDRVFARIHTPGHASTNGRDDGLDPSRMTAQEFGRLVVEEGGRGRRAMAAANPGRRDQIAHESVGCYDLLAVEEVKGTVDALAVLLARHDAKAILEELCGPGKRGTVMNYVDGRFSGPRPFVDLYDLARRCAECDELAPSARAAASAAMKATDDFVLASFGMDGFENFEPGRNGVFIVFPAGDGSSARSAAARTRTFRESGWADWYAPYEVRREGTSAANWAWCRDGAVRGDGSVDNWFELLDSWFDSSDDESGGLNGWRW